MAVTAWRCMTRPRRDAEPIISRARARVLEGSLEDCAQTGAANDKICRTISNFIAKVNLPDGGLDEAVRTITSSLTKSAEILCSLNVRIQPVRLYFGK